MSGKIYRLTARHTLLDFDLRGAMGETPELFGGIAFVYEGGIAAFRNGRLDITGDLVALRNSHSGAVPFFANDHAFTLYGCFNDSGGHVRFFDYLKTICFVYYQDKVIPVRFCALLQCELRPLPFFISLAIEEIEYNHTKL